MLKLKKDFVGLWGRHVPHMDKMRII